METFNELSRIHHSFRAVNTDPDKWDDYDPPRFLSPLERAKYWVQVEEEASEQIAAREDFESGTSKLI